MWRALVVCALASSACTARLPKDETESRWFRIELGGETIGVERRTPYLEDGGDTRWVRERSYRFEINGREASLSGTSETVVDPSGRLVRYVHSSGAQSRRAWMQDGHLVTEQTGSDGRTTRENMVTAPVMVDLVSNPSAWVGEHYPVLEPFSLSPSWVDFRGDETALEWSLNGTLGRRTERGGSFGVLSWRETTRAFAENWPCCADLIELYRLPSTALPKARQARSGTFRLQFTDGRERVLREDRPLWLEIPPGSPIELGPSPDPIVQAYRKRVTKEVRETVDQRTAVMALVRWVQAELETTAVPGSLGHLNALQLGAGDCSEHASLFAAAANAVGIDAEVRWGWVYWDGGYGPGFYPHAWAIVTIDGFGQVPVDPVLGQFPADATHLTVGADNELMSGSLLLPGARVSIIELAR